MESPEWKMPSSRRFCTVAITMRKCRTNTFLPSSIDKFCQIILLSPPEMNGALFFNFPPFLPHTSNFHAAVSQHKLLHPLNSTTPSSFQSKPRWFRPSLSILSHWSVSQSVTRGCCCHRTTFAFLVRRSVKVLEVVARSNNHEQPELSFERAGGRARARQLQLTSLLSRPLAVN